MVAGAGVKHGCGGQWRLVGEGRGQGVEPGVCRGGGGQGWGDIGGQADGGHMFGRLIRDIVPGIDAALRSFWDIL